MAVLRKEPVNCDGKNRRIYDVLVDTEADLDDVIEIGTGSLAYVRGNEEGKRVYVKVRDDRWKQIGDTGEINPIDLTLM